MNKDNLKVFKTTYDGFIVVNENGKISKYEGIKLCPKKIQNYLKKNKPIEINEFVDMAISFGWCN